MNESKVRRLEWILKKLRRWVLHFSLFFYNDILIIKLFVISRIEWNGSPEKNKDEWNLINLFIYFDIWYKHP